MSTCIAISDHLHSIALGKSRVQEINAGERAREGQTEVAYSFEIHVKLKDREGNFNGAVYFYYQDRESMMSAFNSAVEQWQRGERYQ